MKTELMTKKFTMKIIGCFFSGIFLYLNCKYFTQKILMEFNGFMMFEFISLLIVLSISALILFLSIIFETFGWE